MSVIVILHDVNNEEVVVGPFSQVVIEAGVDRTTLTTAFVTIRDVTSGELVASLWGAWWMRDDRPFKQAFIKEHVPG